jgi:LL-diaminopimelate aminotransferase
MDTNIMNGRKIVYIDANESNGFLPLPDDSVDADMIYLCSPNNPSGAVYNKEQLKVWVDYALEKKAIILFDAAYEAYISDESLPHSIFEIEGAKKCAIEFCSLSKTAGFTGTRLAYTIISHELVCKTSRGEVELNRLWVRRQSTKFNGVPYVIQKAGAAVFTEQGMKEAKELIAYYMNNAQTIAKALDLKGIKYFGGVNSPYVWMKCPGDMDSWSFFDALLSRCNVVGTPGAGFGKNGEGYFRLTSFGSHDNTTEAVKRFLEQF